MAKTIYTTPGYVPHPTPPVDKVCANCGKPYSGNPRSKFCTESCQRKNSMRGGKARRERGKDVPTISRLAVARAHGFNCHVCGLPCQLDAPPNQAWSTTTDHVIPTSLRGPHTIENLRLAHMICNSTKNELIYRLPAKEIAGLRRELAKALGVNLKDYPPPARIGKVAKIRTGRPIVNPPVFSLS